MLLVGLTGYQAVQARDALQAAAADFEVLPGQLSRGDTAAARETVASAQEAAQTARENTDGPGWWLGSRLPVVGDDVAAVRTVSDVVDRLSSDVLPRAVDASQTLTPEELRPVKGRVDLAPIEKVAPDVVAASEALDREESRVAAIDTSGLVSQLQAPVVQLQEKLTEASDLTAKAARAAQLLPPMLGADEKRTYLVLFQNNAEIRATGGMPGALATITAENGRISMDRQGGNIDLGTYADPALPTTKEERNLFGNKVGTYPQDSNFTPDFPRTAELVRAQWKRSQGVTVDGVLATDPIALSHVLEGTGPVKLPTGQRLTADDAVQLLLNEVYLTQPDPEMQNVFFEVAARNVFDALARGKGNPRVALDGLTQATEERRLLVWSADAKEQRLLEPTRLSGTLPTGTSSTPQVGVYFNDATAAKMNYYFDYDVSVRSVSCQDGRQDLAVTVKLRSTAPPRTTKLPVSVTGPYSGLGRNSFRTGVYIYLPTGGRLDTATLDGRDYAYNTLSHEGRPVVVQTVELLPGEKSTLKLDVVSGPDQPGQAELRVTPGVHGTGVGEVSESTCS